MLQYKTVSIHTHFYVYSGKNNCNEQINHSYMFIMFECELYTHTTLYTRRIYINTIVATTRH